MALLSPSSVFSFSFSFPIRSTFPLPLTLPLSFSLSLSFAVSVQSVLSCAPLFLFSISLLARRTYDLEIHRRRCEQVGVQSRPGDIWVTRKRGASYKLNLCNYGSNYVGIRAITCPPHRYSALVPSLWLLPSLLMNDSLRPLLSLNSSVCYIDDRTKPLLCAYSISIIEWSIEFGFLFDLNDLKFD